MSLRCYQPQSLGLSAFIVLIGLACSQDILFKNSDEDGKPRPINFDLDKRQMTACHKVCTRLDQCSELYSLLMYPTRSNVMTLQTAACGFTPTGDPLVWCDQCQGSANNNSTDSNNPTETGQHQSQSQSKPFSWTNSEASSGLNENIVLRGQKIHSILNQDDCGTAIPGRISGGESAAKGEFPWMVGIAVHTLNGPQTICGGALVAEDWVITAAHCILDSARHARNISHVRVGAHNITKTNENGAESIPVSKVFFHDQFRERPVVKNDIALLKLRRKAELGTTVGPICVPTGNEDLSSLYLPNSNAVIAGWGSDGHQPGYEILQKLEIPLVSGDTCRKLFQRVRVRVLPDFQVCAGARGRDSCKGDSGGPLMKMDENQRSTLIGIISYGTVQCDGRLPGVYTKLTSYMDWIKEVITKNSQNS